MNREMRKFYRRLLKEENLNVIFTKYNGKIVTSVEPENLNLPEGYNIINNEVFYYDDKIGEIEVKKEDNEDEIDIDDFEIEDLYENEDTRDFTEDNNKKITFLGKVGYFFKKAFERNNDDFDEDFDVEDDEDLNRETEVSEDKTIEEKPKRSIFKKIAHGIKFGISKFFDHFGKKNEVEVNDDVLKDEEQANNDERKSEEDEEVVKTRDKEVIENKFKEIELIIREINQIKSNNSNLDFNSFDERINNGINRFQDLFILYINDDKSVLPTDLIELLSTLTILKNEIEQYIKDNRNQNDMVENNIDENNNKENSKPKKYVFTSIEDTKAKFEEYDKPERKFKEIEEKIAYYEEFLKTHDLSHVDDQGMKERMEAKLATLKEEYNEIMESKKDKVAENNLRSEKMAFYTQTAKGIDGAIDRIELERQYKILQAKLEGKTMINLGLVEERKIDSKKVELLNLKAECLRRKAEVNKYYEEQAARMTKALKR